MTQTMNHICSTLKVRMYGNNGISTHTTGNAGTMPSNHRKLNFQTYSSSTQNYELCTQQTSCYSCKLSGTESTNMFVPTFQKLGIHFLLLCDFVQNAIQHFEGIVPINILREVNIPTTTEPVDSHCKVM